MNDILDKIENAGSVSAEDVEELISEVRNLRKLARRAVPDLYELRYKLEEQITPVCDERIEQVLSLIGELREATE